LVFAVIFHLNSIQPSCGQDIEDTFPNQDKKDELQLVRLRRDPGPDDSEDPPRLPTMWGFQNWAKKYDPLINEKDDHSIEDGYLSRGVRDPGMFLIPDLEQGMLTRPTRDPGMFLRPNRSPGLFLRNARDPAMFLIPLLKPGTPTKRDPAFFLRPARDPGFFLRNERDPGFFLRTVRNLPFFLRTVRESEDSENTFERKSRYPHPGFYQRWYQRREINPSDLLFSTMLSKNPRFIRLRKDQEGTVEMDAESDESLSPRVGRNPGGRFGRSTNSQMEELLKNVPKTLRKFAIGKRQEVMRYKRSPQRFGRTSANNTYLPNGYPSG